MRCFSIFCLLLCLAVSPVGDGLSLAAALPLGSLDPRARVTLNLII
jgi:hypothetical protein